MRSYLNNDIKKIVKLKGYMQEEKQMIGNELGFAYKRLEAGIVTVNLIVYNFLSETNNDVSIHSVKEFEENLDVP